MTTGSSVALVAVGGYGRRRLSPHSDIDLVILSIHGERDVDRDRLRAFTYPLWDSGWQVGHALRSPKEAIAFAERDLPAATSLLTSRFIAGDYSVFEDFTARRTRWINRNRRALLRRVLDATRHRHRNSERAGWALAPELKKGTGGLQDEDTLGWMAMIAGEEEPISHLDDAAGLLLAAREGLHAVVRRKSDRLLIELQPDVAERLGYTTPTAVDDMMARVHSAARVIEHSTRRAMEDLSERTLGGPRRSGSSRRVAEGVRLDDNLLRFEADDVDAATALRLLSAHAHGGQRIAPAAIEIATRAFDASRPARWNESERRAFIELLGGPHVLGALELLEHLGGLRSLLPEWDRIRGRPQHDPYHRFTVDGHSFVAVRELTGLLDAPWLHTHAREIGDLGTLYLATLLHDIGKGSGRNHSNAGAEIALAVAERMGFSDGAAEEIAELVRLHLLLPDTATRRDTDDGSVIESVASACGGARRLRQLLLLSVADGRATGPNAWSEWKNSLVTNLAARTLVALETGAVPARSDVAEAARSLERFEPLLAGRTEGVLASLPPSYLTSTPVHDMAEEIKLLLASPRPGETLSRFDDSGEPGHSVLTVCVMDRPGTLARIAGALALNRIDVLGARAYSTSDGVALTRLIVVSPDEVSKAKFTSDLKAAFSGHLALDASMLAKVKDYRSSGAIVPEVRVLDDASAGSTVVEVRAPDTIGLLYAVAAGLADLELDIHVAKIDTLGDRVVDVFYVRTLWGSKLSERQALEVPRAVLHRTEGLFGVE
ncbi:MAG: [protein-PII] uridylyltransferase [Actinomycetota bacterium]|nr:[protein-PII] uridylyltransferase [Actinomycetota bacterium]